jgi:hypothetical protein
MVGRARLDPDRDGGGAVNLGRLRAKAPLGLDRDDLGHRVGVQREVGAIAGAELDDNAAEPFERPPTMFVLAALDSAAPIAAIEADEERIADVTQVGRAHGCRHGAIGAGRP